MIPVGLARTRPDYDGLTTPFGPGIDHPELAAAGLGPAPNESPNHVYTAVRSALYGLGLDAENYGRPEWNPLGELVSAGSTIVLKPNWIRHWNPSDDGTLESVITHGSVLRAVLDYAVLAAGPNGDVVIAEAPQHDCRFDAIREQVGLEELERFYQHRLGRKLRIIDLRREEVEYEKNIIVWRKTLPGDPLGYRLIDLGERSAFHDSGLNPQRFRGADYDPGPTTEHHQGGKHEYLLSETVLRADLVVNLPKLKTHKKTGVTLALKNLVGINGDKNLLPHHCVGPESAGGDEFPGDRLLDRARSQATEMARVLLKHGIGTRLVGALRSVERAARGDDFIRSGNWYRNRTTWRMCLDLNRCLYYSSAAGEHWEAPEPVRRVLTVIDAVVAGEGEGPLAPTDRPLGVILASLDPVALDLAAIRLMGFDEECLPKVCEAMRSDVLRVTATRSPEDVVVREVVAADAAPRERSLDELVPEKPFVAHSGWLGHVEKTQCAA